MSPQRPNGQVESGDRRLDAWGVLDLVRAPAPRSGYGCWSGAAVASELLYSARPPIAAEALRQARIDPQRPVASLGTRERAISTTRFG
jgi:hypothetical protein